MVNTYEYSVKSKNMRYLWFPLWYYDYDLLECDTVYIGRHVFIYQITWRHVKVSINMTIIPPAR
jgi:hypothetical protein